MAPEKNIRQSFLQLLQQQLTFFIVSLMLCCNTCYFCRAMPVCIVSLSHNVHAACPHFPSMCTWMWLWCTTEHLAHFIENTKIYRVSPVILKIRKYDFWSYHSDILSIHLCMHWDSSISHRMTVTIEMLQCIWIHGDVFMLLQSQLPECVFACLVSHGIKQVFVFYLTRLNSKFLHVLPNFNPEVLLSFSSYHLLENFTHWFNELEPQHGSTPCIMSI